MGNNLSKESPSGNENDIEVEGQEPAALPQGITSTDNNEKTDSDEEGCGNKELSHSGRIYQWYDAHKSYQSKTQKRKAERHRAAERKRATLPQGNHSVDNNEETNLEQHPQGNHSVDDNERTNLEQENSTAESQEPAAPPQFPFLCPSLPQSEAPVKKKKKNKAARKRAGGEGEEKAKETANYGKTPENKIENNTSLKLQSQRAAALLQANPSTDNNEKAEGGEFKEDKTNYESLMNYGPKYGSIENKNDSTAENQEPAAQGSHSTDNNEKHYLNEKNEVRYESMTLKRQAQRHRRKERERKEREEKEREQKEREQKEQQQKEQEQAKTAESQKAAALPKGNTYTDNNEKIDPDEELYGNQESSLSQGSFPQKKYESIQLKRQAARHRKKARERGGNNGLMDKLCENDLTVKSQKAATIPQGASSADVCEKTGSDEELYGKEDSCHSQTQMENMPKEKASDSENDLTAESQNTAAIPQCTSSADIHGKTGSEEELYGKEDSSHFQILLKQWSKYGPIPNENYSTAKSQKAPAQGNPSTDNNDKIDSDEETLTRYESKRLKRQAHRQRRKEREDKAAALLQGNPSTENNEKTDSVEELYGNQESSLSQGSFTEKKYESIKLKRQAARQRKKEREEKEKEQASAELWDFLAKSDNAPENKSENNGSTDKPSENESNSISETFFTALSHGTSSVENNEKTDSDEELYGK